tara:strand:+ start:1103 stop:2116 length:1014 start_codon:yes stop_codon:yes gene_type:complete
MNNLKNLQLQRKFRFLFNVISQLEDLVIGNKESSYLNLNKKCIFVSGMPRSGTTILTHIISNFDDVGSFNYSDLPFTKIPFFWSKINWIYYLRNKSSERIHGDGLRINLLSPDAFEELIWSEHLPNYETGNFSNFLDFNYENRKLEKELARSINKILLLRKKQIYLSKGNYNLFRIKYINKIIKNSFFLICIRNPSDVINSSIKVHKKFLQIGEKDGKFTDEMNELCHFEFGKNRKDPFKNNFYIGETKYYQNQWVRFHKLILDEYKNLNNVFLINFDKLILNPEKSILAIASKIKCKCLGDLTHYIKNKPSKNIENKINDDQISQIYKLLLDKCIN